MRLVHPSRKRELLSVLAVLVLGLGASLLAADRDADARPATTAPWSPTAPTAASTARAANT